MESAMLQPREALGLYDPAQERDACGVGLIAQLHGNPDRSIVIDALSMLSRMFHRGATGVDEASGDGAGMLARLPRRFLTKVRLFRPRQPTLTRCKSNSLDNRLCDHP